ncbi:MAG TPA: DUF3592 domain-containing protein [Arenimonas sp.]|nr:DUF3592 domain-containing protein [Arenimonas sp.]
MKQLLGVLMIIASIGTALHALWRWQRVRASQSWRSTEGEIIEADVRKQASGGPGNVTRTWGAVVRYRYQVGGRSYVGKRLKLGGELDTGSRERAEARLLPYPPGARVDVYYNPTKPADACLERDMEGLAFVFAIAAAFVVVGFVLAS